MFVCACFFSFQDNLDSSKQYHSVDDDMRACSISKAKDPRRRRKMRLIAMKTRTAFTPISSTPPSTNVPVLFLKFKRSLTRSPRSSLLSSLQLLEQERWNVADGRVEIEAMHLFYRSKLREMGGGAAVSCCTKTFCAGGGRGGSCVFIICCRVYFGGSTVPTADTASHFLCDDVI